MTVQEYKKAVPKNANLHGDELWDAMQEYLRSNGSPVRNALPISEVMEGVDLWREPVEILKFNIIFPE